MDRSPKIKAGLLGAGNISEFHARALRRLPHVEIVGVADVNEGRARDMAQRHGLPRAFSSLAQLLQAGSDVIHVLTPPDSHAENAIEALQGGCHVLVEKPLATSVEDCDRVAAAAAASGKQVCVGHSLLRDPFVLRALKIARSGAVGNVIAVDHFRSILYPPYAGGPTPYYFADGGYPFRDLGVHSLYLIEAFLGGIKDAHLELGPPSRDGCPLYKEWRVLVRCDRGTAQICLSGNVQPFQDLLVVQGTRGVVRLDIAGMSVTARKRGRLPGSAERILNTFGEGLGMASQVVGNVLRVLTKRLRRYHGLQALVSEFYTALAAGTTPPVTTDQARPIIDWTERIARQADCQKQQYVSRFAMQGTAKTLVTGATGFIGRHLLKRLLGERDRVRILVRHEPADGLLHDPRVEVFLGNLGNPDDVDRAVQGASEVFHLGATIEGWAEDFQCATVVGTQNVVNSALAHDVEKLIYMSSLSVIHAAAARNGDKIAEDWPLEPFPEKRGLYSQTKLAAERIVSHAVLNRGLHAVILRPGEVMGPDKIFLSGAVGREAGGRVIVLGNGKSTIPLIWVEDLVDAILAAAQRSRLDGGAFNLVDPEQVTQDELAEHYLKAKGRRVRIFHVPLAALYPAAAVLDLGLQVLGRNAPITPYRLRSAIGSRDFDCAAAAEKLGWKPHVGVRRGLAAMAKSNDGSRRYRAHCPSQ